MMDAIVSQRSDYTFKYNRKLGRHGWLRLTPAYSVKLVKELLEGDTKSKLILDPFSGTATTGLVSAEFGKQSILYEINPFLIWFGNAKCAQYSNSDIKKASLAAKNAVHNLSSNAVLDFWVPNIHNIERWWCGSTLPIIAALRNEIVTLCGEPGHDAFSNLVWVGFCRLIIETSSAAFNHVSMSFQDGVTTFDIEEVSSLFLYIIDAILESASDNPVGKAKVLHFDSRNERTSKRLYEHVVTSPPYPNRISYIRELRPYMYWTKFLTETRQAGDLDWEAIGGTWGVATSRLNDWKPTAHNLPESLMETALAIQKSDGKNAFLMAQYVLKYFNDMFLHFESLKKQLKKGARINYIVGNSTFFGIPVHTEKLYGDILHSLGYRNIETRVVRKRNSKKELFEFDVFAEFDG
ncbi:DNA methyltransferase [Candidatus Spongiihabitans sp.]|uniref:DNA methyltransferase n=1 Tax=Candidatus Spongiihabitans sp. TaxID=3101308 RepID=UPI003C704FEB